MGSVDELRASEFIAAARALSLAAVGLGLRSPGFRSPPRRRDVPRTIRRDPGGVAVVAIRRVGRSGDAVLGDMVDGVLAASSVDVVAARRHRPILLEAAYAALGRPAPVAELPVARPVTPARPADPGVAA